MPIQATETLAPKRTRAGAMKLVVVSGADFGRTLLLDRGSYRVGKEEGVDLQLSDPAVSRTHLIVEVLPHGIRAADNRSHNGSFVNDVRFESIELSPPAVIRVGRTLLKLATDDEPLPLRPSERESFGFMVGGSLPMRQLYAALERIAQGSSDVLLEGETGTGKECCARSIHRESARAKSPFVVFDFSAVPAAKAERQLFEAFEKAGGGTLFLDEVGMVSAELQPRLLRTLEGREVNGKTLDLRVICASREQLEAKLSADLFHRIAVVRLKLPPLRDRLDDIPALVRDLLAGLGKESSAIEPKLLQQLRGYHWPGNVRELRNVVERAVTLGGAELPEAAQAPASDGVPAFKEAKDALIDAFEKEYVVKLLASVGGNVSEAARTAKVTRAYFQRLMRKHGL